MKKRHLLYFLEVTVILLIMGILFFGKEAPLGEWKDRFLEQNLPARMTR